MIKSIFSKKSVRNAAITIYLLAVMISLFSVLSFADGGFRSFTSADQQDPLYVKKHFEKLPMAYSATLSVPANLSQYCPVISNYPNATNHYFGFNIEANGKPAIAYNNKTAKTTATFSYDLRGKSNVNVTVVCETETGSAVYKLYIDGVLQQTITGMPTIHNIDPKNSQSNVRELSIGTDGRSQAYTTPIAIKDIFVYSEAPSYTAEGGLSFKEGSLMASYENMTEHNDFIRDTSGNGHDAMRNSYYVNTVEGMSFSDRNVANPLVINNYLKKIPRTIEAELFMPAGISSTSPVFGSYNNGSGTYLGLEINASGNPVVYYRTYFSSNNQVRTNVVFKNYDVRGKGYIKLAVTNETDSGNSVYKLYVNGVLVDDNGAISETIKPDGVALASSPYVHDFDIVRAQRVTKEFTVGCDGLNYFKGKMKSVAIYDTALDEGEILDSYNNGADLENGSMLAYYDLMSKNNSDVFIKDETENGHDLTPNFFERKNELKDYAYSFAFLGDTQFLVYEDVMLDRTTPRDEPLNKHTPPIYDWLLANKDSKNIQYVFGLGDVTDANADAEWAYAKKLYQRLDGEIPYAIIPGNHDTVVKLDKYFASEPSLTDNITGYYKEGSVGNYYMNFEVMGHKYTVLTLEYGANDATLAWANEVVASEECADRQVIVLTHCYMDYDGERTYAGGPGGLTVNANTGYVYNNGEDMWNEFIKLHENITMVVCGHIDPLVIQRRHDDKGVNGNTVHQFIIDPQAIDHAHGNETGMIAMFYFSEDGSEVQVEYVSAYKSMEEGKDILFRDENQFSFTIDELGSERTPYGVIPAAMVSDDKPIALFRNGKCIGTYALFSASSGGGSALEAAKNELIGGSYASEEDGTVYIYFRDNASATNRYENFGQIIGKIVVDLNGKTLTQDYAGNTLFYTLMKYYNKMGDLTIEVKNGDILLERSLMTFDGDSSYASVATDTRYKTVNYEFDNVNFSLKANMSSYSENFLGYFDTKSSASKLLKYNVVFNDCNFDLTGFVAKSTSVFMNANDPNTSKTNAVVNVTVNGGSLTLADSSLKLSDTISNGSSVTFGKGSDGKYMTLIAPTAPALSNSVYITGGAESVFVAYKTDGTNQVCSLMPKAILGFAPKSSITLYSNFIYNVYLPRTDAITSVLLDGKTVDLNTLITVKLDNEDYYKLPVVSLKSYEAVRDISLTVTLAAGGEEYKGNYTFDLCTYAESILSGTDTAEIALAKDMLSYAKAAYTYWGKTSDKLSAIDTLLGADYNNTADMSKADTATAPENTGFTGVTLHLGDAPSYRFYYTGTAPTYTFNVGERTVKATEGSDESGKYLEVKVYAYEMLLDVTFGTHTYSAYSYYAYAKAKNMTREMALVERLINYCESAEAYRAGVAK